METNIHKCPPFLPILCPVDPVNVPTFTSWWSILISSHLRLGLSHGLFPSGYPTKTLYRPLLSPIRATCTANFILLDFITRTILRDKYRSLSSSLCSFLLSIVNSSPLSPNTLLNILFSNTLSLRSFLDVSDQVSHPYKSTGKIIVLCILNFKFLGSKLEHKRFCTEWQQEFPEINFHFIWSWIEFWFVKFVHKNLNSSTLSKKL